MHPNRRPPAAAGAPRPLALVACALALAAALLVAPPAEARHQQGEKVQVTGLVTDPSGAPLGDVRVVLEASRKVFSLRRFAPVVQDTTRLAAATDARGEYTLVWPWDKFYNQFDLVVGVPVRVPGGEKLEVLETVDITRRIDGPTDPVVVPLVVQNVDFLHKLRDFLASVDSDDEKRVYRELGRPDRVELHGEGRESWWYFAQGKRYDFADGRLVETKGFEPVQGP